MQLQLFTVDPCEHLFPYWRGRLERWPAEVFRWRHYRYTTGWSMCCSEYSFARSLFCHGQITRRQLRRYWRFDRRVMRWEKMTED